MNKRKTPDFYDYFSPKKQHIDETYEVAINKDANNLVYLLILSHGSVMFQTNQPVAVRVPENIKYINKITYTPLNP